MAKFKVGDVVILRSGGHHMTVHQIPSDDEFYTCVFSKNNEVQAWGFREEELILLPKKWLVLQEEIAQMQGRVLDMEKS